MSKTARKSSNFSTKAKIRLLLRDGSNCVYCVKKITRNDDLTVDHIVPLVKGGSNEMDNLALSCKHCNEEKGRLLLTEFIRAKELVMTRELARFL